MFKPTNLKDIREKVVAYHNKMNAISKFLKENKAPAEIQIDPDKEFIEFYIDKESMIRLNNIALLPDFDSFAVFFGLANKNDKHSVTGCFLGINSKKEILTSHKITKQRGKDKPVPGEDTWLPPGGKKYKKHPKDFTLKTDIKTIEKHLKG